MHSSVEKLVWVAAVVVFVVDDDTVAVDVAAVFRDVMLPVFAVVEIFQTFDRDLNWLSVFVYLPCP
jgi:hypothetical protein